MNKESVKPEASDEEIARRVHGGDDAAFDVLADRYRTKLTHYVRKLIGPSDDAHDVVQDALIKAHKAIDTFDPERKFSPWMYRITHNEAINAAKKSARGRTVSLDDTLSTADEKSLADVELSSLERWFQQELKEQMHSAIAQLPDAYAEVIHLRYIEELSYKEISEILDKPVNTVGTLVSRAKKKLLEIVVVSEKF